MDEWLCTMNDYVLWMSMYYRWDWACTINEIEHVLWMSNEYVLSMIEWVCTIDVLLSMYYRWFNDYVLKMIGWVCTMFIYTID